MESSLKSSISDNKASIKGLESELKKLRRSRKKVPDKHAKDLDDWILKSEKKLEAQKLGLEQNRSSLADIPRQRREAHSQLHTDKVGQEKAEADFKGKINKQEKELSELDKKVGGEKKEKEKAIDKEFKGELSAFRDAIGDSYF